MMRNFFEFLLHLIYSTLFCSERLISGWNAGLEISVSRARILMSSLEQSLETRTNSPIAPPLIMSLAFASVSYQTKALCDMPCLVSKS